ncbi:hypothetical protein FRC17_005748, partial [Serendipita sp. 399]
MDDFGGSAVWGDAPSSSSFTAIKPPNRLSATTSLFGAPKDDDPFDEFAEFENTNPVLTTTTTTITTTATDDDDDFGDFGDFTEEVTPTPGQTQFEEDSFGFEEDH